ncbi:hypothetical protein [Prevotella sp. HUN102]|uniref:hypothetical protein n=1 Tax=Prevotella sp. HUN102 TaxID=1392486 RepID=UPI000490C677|nr:hypothetical protein [Prevotella sp. HUN102]
MNISQFKISKISKAVLNWSYFILVIVVALGFHNAWVGMPKTEMNTVDGTAVLQALDPFQVVQNVLFVLSELAIFEIFRRCLQKAKHFSMNLMMILLMVLSLLITVVQLIPSGDTISVHGTFQTTDFSKFKDNFVPIANLFLFLSQMVLGVSLIRKFVGKIRQYGWALVLCPLLTLVFQGLYTYMYTSVGGLSLNDLATYFTISQIATYAMMIVPLVMIRFTMSDDPQYEDGDDTDVSEYK